MFDKSMSIYLFLKYHLLSICYHGKLSLNFTVVNIVEPCTVLKEHNL